MADVIIIEDEEGLRVSLLEGLEQVFPDHSFAAYGSVEEAQDEVVEHPPRVVVSDIRLPGANGLDFLQTVKAQHPSVRFILMTAFHGIVSPDQARDRGAFHLLRKPFPLAKLIDALERALSAQFAGVVDAFSLMELLQLVNLSKKSLSVVVDYEDQRGELVFEGGELIHAEVGEEVGFTAFQRMITWPGGDYSTRKPAAEPIEHSIHIPFQQVALEAFRLLDEEKRDEADEEDDGFVAEPPPTTDEAASGETDDEPVDPVTEAFDRLEAENGGHEDSPTTADESSDSGPRVSVDVSLDPFQGFEGLLAACLVETTSGRILRKLRGDGLDLEGIASASAELLQRDGSSIPRSPADDQVEEVLASFSRYYHLIRNVRDGKEAFVLLLLDRERSNVGLARRELRKLADVA